MSEKMNQQNKHIHKKTSKNTIIKVLLLLGATIGVLLLETNGWKEEKVISELEEQNLPTQNNEQELLKLKNQNEELEKKIWNIELRQKRLSGLLCIQLNEGDEKDTYSVYLNDEIGQKFIKNQEVLKLLESKNNILIQVCDLNNSLAFVILSRDKPEMKSDKKSKNIIGIFDGDKIKTTQIFVQNSGDVGLCNIKGHIEKNPIYSCGGGDGPAGFNTVYIFDRVSGIEKEVKNCNYYYDDDRGGYKAQCEVNKLDLPELPFD